MCVLYYFFVYWCYSICASGLLALPPLLNCGPVGRQVVRVSAERAYEAGESLVISYGLKSAAECLEDHGLVPDLSSEDASCEVDQ